MTSSKRNEQNRLFGASLGLVLALNVLFSLVHTLREASSLMAHAWNTGTLLGPVVIAAVLGGVYFFAHHDKRPVLGVSLALAALLTQVHIFSTQPALLGWYGVLYYLVDIIAVALVVYDRVLQRRANRHEDSRTLVVTLDDHRRETSSHAA